MMQLQEKGIDGDDVEKAPSKGTTGNDWNLLLLLSLLLYYHYYYIIIIKVLRI